MNIYLPNLNSCDVIYPSNILNDNGKVMRIFTVFMDFEHNIVTIEPARDPSVFDFNDTGRK